jgi:hypothetical protein
MCVRCTSLRFCLNGPRNGIFAESFFHFVNGQVQVYHFGGVFKQVELLCPVYQVAEPYANETDEHAPAVKPAEKFLY